MPDVEKMLLEVVYAEGLITAEEYMALHFDDIRSLLADRLEIAAEWVGLMDYDMEGDLTEPKVRLLVQNEMTCQTLQIKGAVTYLESLVLQGCGQKVKFDIGVGDFETQLARQREQYSKDIEVEAQQRQAEKEAQQEAAAKQAEQAPVLNDTPVQPHKPFLR